MEEERLKVHPTTDVVEGDNECQSGAKWYERQPEVARDVKGKDKLSSVRPLKAAPNPINDVGLARLPAEVKRILPLSDAAYIESPEKHESAEEQDEFHFAFMRDQARANDWSAVDTLPNGLTMCTREVDWFKAHVQYRSEIATLDVTPGDLFDAE